MSQIFVVPDSFKFTIEWNPIAVLIGMYHQVILYGEIPSAWQFIFVILFIMLVLVLGTKVFEKHRESFAEAL